MEIKYRFYCWGYVVPRGVQVLLLHSLPSRVGLTSARHSGVLMVGVWYDGGAERILASAEWGEPGPSSSSVSARRERASSWWRARTAASSSKLASSGWRARASHARDSAGLRIPNIFNVTEYKKHFQNNKTIIFKFVIYTFHKLQSHFKRFVLYNFWLAAVRILSEFSQWIN